MDLHGFRAPNDEQRAMLPRPNGQGDQGIQFSAVLPAP